MIKWLAGIGATIVGGLVIWWLTHPNGPLHMKQPSVKLVGGEIELPDLSGRFGDTFKGTFTVYNEGDTTAERCVLFLRDGRSAEFGLRPNTELEVHAESRPITPSSGGLTVYEVEARISCSGYERTLYSERRPLTSSAINSSDRVIMIPRQ